MKLCKSAQVYYFVHFPWLYTLKATELNCQFDILVNFNKVLVIVIVKPVLSVHSKIDKTKVLKPCGYLMQIKSIAECEHSAILLTCVK